MATSAICDEFDVYIMTRTRNLNELGLITSENANPPPEDMICLVTVVVGSCIFSAGLPLPLVIKTFPQMFVCDSPL